MALTDVLVVNRVEAAQIMGTTPAALDAQDAARTLARMGPRAVLVTLGADGAVLCDVNAITSVPAPYRASGSTHGAGDAYVGALVAELDRGVALPHAAHFAAAAAALFVATPPDQRAKLTRSAVEASL